MTAPAPTPEQIVAACLRNWLPFRFTSSSWAHTVAGHIVHNLDQYGWLRTRPARKAR